MFDNLFDAFTRSLTPYDQWEVLQTATDAQQEISALRRETAEHRTLYNAMLESGRIFDGELQAADSQQGVTFRGDGIADIEAMVLRANLRGWQDALR